MKKYLIIMSMLFAGWTTEILGQTDSTMVMQPIETDRPDESEAASLVPRGYFQMEHGFKVEDTNPGFIYSYPSSLWRFGVNDNFEIRLITEYITIQKEPSPDLNGFLPLSLGFKTKLAEQKGILPKIALLTHFTFPGVVSEEFETTYFAPDIRLAFQHKVSDFFSVGYNVGAAWNGEDGEPDFLYSLSAGIAISNRLGLFGELYGSTPQRDDSDPELRADAGLTYLIGNDFLLDLSAGTGLTEDAVEEFVAFGFSYRFKL
jgi:hypothetical protein